MSRTLKKILGFVLSIGLIITLTDGTVKHEPNANAIAIKSGVVYVVRVTDEGVEGIAKVPVEHVRSVRWDGLTQITKERRAM